MNNPSAEIRLLNYTLLGCQVLWLSKQIMNEVICLAYDFGCYVSYQDTLILFISSTDLPKLEQELKLKYGCELRY